MPATVKQHLADLQLLDSIVVPPEIGLLLDSLEIQASVTDAGGTETGTVNLRPGVNNSPLPGFDFALEAPTGIVEPAPYKFEHTGATSFNFWVALADQGQARLVFKFVRSIPGLVLTGAEKVDNADGTVTLKAIEDAADPRHTPTLVSRGGGPGAALGPALLVTGSDSQPASIHITPDTSSTKGVVAFGLEPSTVVFGSSEIGFDCPAVTIDDSDAAAAPGAGAPGLDPPLAHIPADDPAWQGIVVRELDFYLPASVPLFGGHPIAAYLAIPTRAGGAELVVESHVAAVPAGPGGGGARPGYSIRIECRDPTAVGLSGLVPTLIRATMELPLDGARAGFDGGGAQTVQFAAGKPVIAAAALARDPVNSPGTFTATVGVSGQGPDGLLSVTSNAMGGAKIFNTAAALATAIIADKDVDKSAKVGDTPAVVLYGLLAAGAALSSLFTPDSKFVLHGVEIDSTGHGLPVGGPVAMTIDYSVAVTVVEVSIGVLSVEMDPNMPMRIRVRKARMSVDPSASGLQMIALDFDHASMEIEDPGVWKIHGLEPLFDVLGSRSGRGSSWIEVDLGFKLNLGPVKVSQATIRATLDETGNISASVRGLEVDVSVPGAITGSGSLQLEQPQGFDANLRATLVPLNVAADAGIIYAPPKVVLRLGVDLPAPVPIGTTGFGLLGVGGLLGFSATPDFSHVESADPVVRQLEWTPENADSFAASPGEDTFGIEAAVGTLPDLGFIFSAKAGIVITVPDLAFRGGLNGRVLQPPVKVSEKSWPPVAPISFVGFVAADKDAVSFALLGNVDLKPLLEVKVPLAGYFPHDPGGASDWYVYLGADGAPTPPEQGRAIGPISATVLPGIVDVNADAYLMVRGKGITGWPYGRPMPGGPLKIPDGFIVAFGFSLQNTFGPKPIVWAELYASLDVLLASKPPTLAGFGQAGGSLNLGPFSLGVQASVMFILSDAAKYFWAQVTGRIELLFVDIEGTVTISFGDEPTLALPPPSVHPLDTRDADGKVNGSLGALSDDSYRVVAPLVEDPAAITDQMRVWPDALVSVPFAVTPAISDAPDAFLQFPGVRGPNAAPPPMRLGGEMLHYDWQLDDVTLVDVTHEADPFVGAGTPPSGQLSAAWQLPRTDASGGDVNELILFSNGPDVWLNRLGDGGATLPGDPVSVAGTLCETTLDAPRPGWAVGYLAAETSRGFHLPADPISLDPFQSRVNAQMHHLGLAPQAVPAAGTGATLLDGTPALPPLYTLAPAALVPWPAEHSFGRLFDGHLQAPSLHWLDGAELTPIVETGPYVRQEIRLDLSDAVTDGAVVLVVPAATKALRGAIAGVDVTPDRGNPWKLVLLQQIPTGDLAAIYRPATPAEPPVSTLFVAFALGYTVGVVGVEGVTVSASDAVANENQQRAAQAARLQAAAAAGPKIDPTTNLAHQRAILGPDRLYRIDLSFHWAGAIKKQDDSGQLVTVASKTFGDTDTDKYAPSDGSAAPPSRPAKRQLFFRTAPKPPDPPKPAGSKLYSVWLHKQQDVFQPEMLLRYLGGYEPAQSEQFRFRGDPIRAHFTQDHVAALAKAYGFDLLVAAQRGDAQGPAYASPQLVKPEWTFATDSRFLGSVDQRRYAVAASAPCPVPKPGSTATVRPPVPLDAEAWYDVHVVVQATNPAFADGTLPGVTFRTSKWIEPLSMLADLGFAPAGGSASTGVVNGDVLVASATLAGPPVVEDDDQAFDAARIVLGVDGWPSPAAPRLSRLWTKDASSRWLFAGLMVESPEPIHRPGRFELTGLTLQMGHSAGTIAFDVRRRDRAGARLLYLTSTPFIVITRERAQVGWPVPHWQFQPVHAQVTLSANSIVDDTTTPVAATLPLPAVPSFAGDP